VNELPELTVAVEVGIPVGKLVIATVGGSVLVDVSVIPVVGVNEGEAVVDGVGVWVVVGVVVTAGVNVIVEVGVLLAVGIFVDVTVAVDVLVDVIVWVAVGVNVKVEAAVEVDVNVATAVDVKVGVFVRVAVDVDVKVVVGDGVDVRVAVEVEVDVGVPVSVLWVVMSSCGGVVPSREEKVTPSVLSATKANVYVPFPLTKAVTLYSTQEFVAIAPLLSNAPLKRTGWVFQVTPPVPDSIQLLFAKYAAGPFAVPLVVQKTRNFALWIDPLMPLILKRI
jgi:hypothetical protein